MKQRSLFVFCLIFFGLAGFASAQSVTNADLEKYRQERLNAERNLRENYAALGFSSPEELERRREQSRIETEQLSAKLRAERLERERLEAQRAADSRAAAVYQSYSQFSDQQYAQPGYYWSYGRRYRSPARHNQYQQPGYFAGGQFWPTGPATRPQPLFRVRRR